MSNWLLLVVGATFISLNAIDAILTRIALRKGHQEFMPHTKALIENQGLDRAMLIKVLLLTLGAILFIALGWVNVVINFVASIAFIILDIRYSYIVAHDCIELWKNRH